jgi:serine/threonine-protein kinase HipA
VDPWLWGLLPDNERVLARWAAEYHASAKSAFSLLSTPVGHDCAGAVQFVGKAVTDEVLGRESRIEWLSEVQVADRLRLLRKDATAWLGRSNPGQFSLAGAQAKTALVLDGEAWGVPHGTIPTTHILKPAIAGLDDQDLNEHLCLSAARRAGLRTAQTWVQRFDGESAIVVRRYDRIERAGRRYRVHQEDLCQALGFRPDQKYEVEGGPSAADVIRLIREVVPRRDAEVDAMRFVDALIWNWLIAGTDAHAKNYSLLIAGGMVRLAPLYDIASGLPYFHERKMKFAMRLAGDYRIYDWSNRWPGVAKELGLDAEQVIERAVELAELAPEAFRDAAGVEAVKALGSPLSSQLVDLVADRARRCGRLIRQAPNISS